MYLPDILRAETPGTNHLEWTGKFSEPLHGHVKSDWHCSVVLKTC